MCSVNAFATFQRNLAVQIYLFNPVPVRSDAADIRKHETNLGAKAEVGQNRKLASRTVKPLRKEPKGKHNKKNKNDQTTTKMSLDQVLRVGVGRSRPYSDFSEK